MAGSNAPNDTPAKPVIRSIVRCHSSAIHDQTSGWNTPESQTDWVDIQLTKPLDWLLAADDEEAALKQFVVDAIADLNSAGIVDDLNKAVEQLREDA